MSRFEWKASFASALLLIAVVRPEFSFAQSQTSLPQLEQPGRVSIAYIPPDNIEYREAYDLLQKHHALEKIQEY